jgi:hypothetical protein
LRMTLLCVLSGISSSSYPAQGYPSSVVEVASDFIDGVGILSSSLAMICSGARVEVEVEVEFWPYVGGGVEGRDCTAGSGTLSAVRDNSWSASSRSARLSVFPFLCKQHDQFRTGLYWLEHTDVVFGNSGKDRMCDGTA